MTKKKVPEHPQSLKAPPKRVRAKTKATSLDMPPLEGRKVRDLPTGDRKEAFGNITVMRYSPELALKVLERIAKGDLLKDICSEPGMPKRATWWKWVMLYEGLDKAYNAARELSAQTLEEKALGIAAQLEAKHNFTGTRVRGFDLAMQQYRWSASHRDPARYGSSTSPTLIVPIQINTTLDINAGDTGAQGIYNIKADIKEPTGEYALKPPVEPDRRLDPRPDRIYSSKRNEQDGQGDGTDNIPGADWGVSEEPGGEGTE